MARKSDNPKQVLIAVRMTSQEVEWLDYLVRGLPWSTRSEILRRALKYAYEHPFQVLNHKNEETK